MKASDKLRAWWSQREQDIMGSYPLGQQTKGDLGFLLHALGSVVDEMDRRGYDRRTFRFSIQPKPGNARFASQRPEAPKVAPSTEEEKQ